MNNSNDIILIFISFKTRIYLDVYFLPSPCSIKKSTKFLIIGPSAEKWIQLWNLQLDRLGLVCNTRKVGNFVAGNLIFFDASSFLIIKQVTSGTFVQFGFPILGFAEPESSAITIVFVNAFVCAFKFKSRRDDDGIL